mmetsp:Transcript_7713/g.14509  ORF Transcript_7713/g.14509 Transcript_7713/m.14509 type:complete len:518 (+) Transcript_7713:180-1733(+)|eukprot:CAMPEP_0114227390 /NCGR_PEP_ID=MMETSP0058-20121206/1766_1 /TAXON_ID=36894 /ORGANISM="Pyramimonas parkeae, CCMP726" /LENGTH=517 /DNA_ID=CAMNT_0001338231 /DNA_START=125 /DNA_END=1678 /DNA_ORIENTATION=+
MGRLQPDDEDCRSNPLAPADSGNTSDDGSTLNPAFLIELVRRMMTAFGPCGNVRKTFSTCEMECVTDTEHDTSMSGSQNEGFKQAQAELGTCGNLFEDAEDAGCILWDVTTIPEQASFLLTEAQLPAVLLLVLQSKCSDRLTEIVLGTLANLACHKGAAAHLLGVAGMQEAVLECFFASVHPPTLTEAARFLRVAVEAENACIASSPARLGSEQKDGEPEQAAAPGGDVSGWRGVVTTQPYASAVFARAAWILENSLSEPLVQHAADLVSALTCISAEGAASYVVEANMTASLKEALKAMTSQTLESSALDAVLRAMEAVCSVEGCAKAFSVDVEVVSTLLRILAPAVEDAGGECAVSAIIVLSCFAAVDDTVGRLVASDASIITLLINLAGKLHMEIEGTNVDDGNGGVAACAVLCAAFDEVYTSLVRESFQFDAFLAVAQGTRSLLDLQHNIPASVYQQVAVRLVRLLSQWLEIEQRGKENKQPLEHSITHHGQHLEVMVRTALAETSNTLNMEL